jgi:hypothetical protein
VVATATEEAAVGVEGADTGALTVAAALPRMGANCTTMCMAEVQA